MRESMKPSKRAPTSVSAKERAVGVAAHPGPSGDQLIEHETESIEIGSVVDNGSPDLFGSLVSEDGPAVSEGVGFELRRDRSKPDVEDLHITVEPHHDMPRCELSMCSSEVVVNDPEPLTDLEHDEHSEIDGE
jgi:hypothetical protein